MRRAVTHALFVCLRVTLLQRAAYAFNTSNGHARPPSSVVDPLVSHARIRSLFTQSHGEFGCIPDRNRCPTWDCAAFYTTETGCQGVPTNASDAPLHLPWRLCYDRGLVAYAFTTQLWCSPLVYDDDCCECTATRLHKPDAAYVCTECQPCCTHCAAA